MHKGIKEHTIREFKGLNYSNKGIYPEASAIKEDEFVDVLNWNVAGKGFFEKRYGVEQVWAVTESTTPSRLRLLLAQRRLPDSNLQPVILCTDSDRLWGVRSAVNGGAFEYRIGSAGGPVIGNVQWAIEYGGTASATAYNVTAVRSSPTYDFTTAQGGMITIPANSTITNNWVANSPPGTHMTLHKTRTWIVNSYGGDAFATPNTAGDETKVWFSNGGDLTNFGGVGAPNNFNLEFGDGDYLVASVPYNDQLLFFKTRKTYVVSVGPDPLNWTYRALSDHIGCVGRGTIKHIDGKIYFLSTEGVVRTDGSQAELISDPIEDLLETYRDFKNPQNAMDIFASYYKGKYILWIPRTLETSVGDNALVFDLATQTWTQWRLTGGVSCWGEVRVSEKWDDALFFGSWAGNKIWKMSRNVWTDNGTAYSLSFTTKKHNFGSPMSRKRLHLVGLTVKDEAPATSTYVISTKHDDATPAVSKTQAPTTFSHLNIKVPGGGYGSYFQTTVSNGTSTGYAAVYDLTWMSEERALEPRSVVGGRSTNGIVHVVGPHPQDKLDAGFVLG